FPLSPVLAQEDGAAPAAAASAEPEAPGDPLGRDTPLGAVSGFLQAAEAFDWSLAARYLDLRYLPGEASRVEPEVLAEQFYFILQRRELEVDPERISDQPEGNLLEDQPDYRDELAQVQTRRGVVTLLLQRVPARDGRFVWKVSNATMQVVPALYDEFSYPAWVERIRLSVPQDRSFLGIEWFKWIIILGYLAVVIPLVLGLAYLVARIVSSPGSALWQEIRSLLMGPVTGLVVIWFLTDLIYELEVGTTAARIMRSHTLGTFFTVWFIWKAVDIWRARRRHQYELQGRSDAAVLGRPIANAIKLVTVLIGLLVWLANLGVDISALLAGLGIGGIAVALALQKPIEDLFGAISIYAQQPVTQGDFCRYGDSLGTVEEIGLRTTRIRTLSNTLVNVPNSQLSTGIIENLTARTKILYQPDLPLRYDTSREQLMAVLEAIEEKLVENPRVENDTIRVRLREFSPNAIIVRIRMFAQTRNIDTYLEIVQEVNLDIMKIMDDHQVRFSQGAQTLFIKGDPAAAKQFPGGMASEAEVEKR
ncbi:MAG: mechanosensitive ion channel family protein, partial [Xanthomonadales bacterium]|nr:mechanosensitive ion channel family protein [Xanthomonadales bacterium]